MKKILITGGAGYIGNVLIEELFNSHSSDVEITVIDNLLYNQTCFYQYSHLMNFKFIKQDITNPNIIQKYVNDYDIIIPLAALVGFKICDNKQLLAENINYKQIVRIVDSCKNNQLIIFPNTNSGYGMGLFKQGQLCYCTQQTPLNPISIYGKTKCNAEQYIINNYNNYVIFRLATVFGASNRMRLDLLVNDFTYRALNDKFIVLFEPYFKRNYIHIRDVARAFISVIFENNIKHNQVYNLGLNQANLSKMQLCQKIKQYVPDFYITISQYNKDIDQRNYIVSNDKLLNTGYTYKYSIDDGIKQLINLYKILNITKEQVFNA